jgi:hypothetical protein
MNEGPNQVSEKPSNRIWGLHLRFCLKRKQGPEARVQHLGKGPLQVSNMKWAKSRKGTKPRERNKDNA